MMTAAEIGAARRSGGWRPCRYSAHNERDPSVPVHDGDHGLTLRAADPRAAAVRVG
jgi:hypothetical protein